MNVPLLDLRPQLDDLREEIVESVINVIDSTRYIGGPEVENLENEVAAYCNVDHGVGVSSGTDALLAALMTLDIGNGDKVITTPYSFFATMGVILRVGAEPLFADIDPVSYNIDPNQIQALLESDNSGKIKAIIPVHLYGQCADMERILKIAREFEVPIIEDAAQAIGAEMPIGDDNQWYRAGSMGLAGCFSFFPSKNLGGIGDGGMVVSTNEQFSKRLALMRNHGAYPKYFHEMVGGNFRLDPIQAAVLRIKLRKLDQWHQGRINNANLYHKLFESAGLLDDDQVILPEAVYRKVAEAGEQDRHYHIYNQFVIRVKQRDQLREYLASEGIGTEIYYPLALHQQKCLGNKANTLSLVHAETAAAETLALPIFPELTDDMQEFVVAHIKRFYNQ
ncbi:MAG: DegT/DnrJ/EryC1/StrS family aminotransferase [Desulfobulbaceae bacterium]|nr:MAG: DegT/DnrJ/EryC1/StrS family aminotransferase [Desulfobulbaceae bacterium]